MDCVAVQIAVVGNGNVHHGLICERASSRAIVLALVIVLVIVIKKVDHEQEHEHDYEEGATIGIGCNLSECFANSSRKTFVNPASCKMFMSVLCLGMSSFSHDSFHQQNPMTAGQRPENRSSSAFLAHSLASTFRW